MGKKQKIIGFGFNFMVSGGMITVFSRDSDLTTSVVRPSVRTSVRHQNPLIINKLSLISCSSVVHQSLISRSSVAHQLLIVMNVTIATFKRFLLVIPLDARVPIAIQVL